MYNNNNKTTVPYFYIQENYRSERSPVDDDDIQINRLKCAINYQTYPMDRYIFVPCSG